MTLGENLQALRKAHGISQEEVAGRLFVSRQSVSKWENDQAEPGVENLKALAELYGVTLDRLTGRTEPPEETPAEPADAPWNDEEARERRNRFAEEERLRSWYVGLVVGRTILVALGNLFSWAAYRNINFPFDWIFMLAGLGVRRDWVYYGIVVTECLNLLFNVFRMLSGNMGSLVGVAMHIIILAACLRGETRDYFHQTGRKEGKP